MHEIEKKFIINNIPDTSMFKHHKLRQGYVSLDSNGTEVRIREKNDQFFLTVKSSGGLVRTEVEIEIDNDNFNNLWLLCENRIIQKTRFLIPAENSIVYELDIFEGSLCGLAILEIEFDSVESAKNFSPPSWFGEEVTNNKKYKNKNLAVYGI